MGWGGGGGGCTNVVCPDLEGLLLAHEQPDLVILLVLEQLDLPHPALLPL